MTPEKRFSREEAGDSVSEAEVPLLEPGSRLAPGYEIVEHLHRSNVYDVYDVYSEERACSCIAKVPTPDRLYDREACWALLREGERLQGLMHPHLVRCYEVLNGSRPTLILETLTGETLAHLIDTSSRRLPAREISFLGLHLCSAVYYLHRQGLLHLDLKPSNIVSERGMAKVIDLSVARSPGQGKPGVGTRQYMAPEQARGGNLTVATDVWGIGAVLFEAATARFPFAAYEEETSCEDDSHQDEASGDSGVYEESSQEEPARYEQLERRADPVRRYRRLPAPLALLVDGCLELDPGLRPTLDELADGLRAFAEG